MPRTRMCDIRRFFGTFYDCEDRPLSFGTPLKCVAVHLELWVYKGLFGLNNELLWNFETLYTVHIVIRIKINGIALFIYGQKLYRTLTMILIVSLAWNLRIKRNRARALARGLHHPVWWSSRYFI